MTQPDFHSRLFSLRLEMLIKCAIIAAGIGGSLAFSPPVGIAGQQCNLRGSAAVRSSSSLAGISMSSREASSSGAAAERR
jgi:hypothetical protein